MKNFLVKIGFIVTSFLVITTVIAGSSLWLHRKSSFYKPSFLVNEVKEKQFDYIILGASTGLTTLNTATIDSITNSIGINLAVDNTALPCQYLMLQHFLAQGKTTKLCVIAPSVPSFDARNKDVSHNDYRFLPYVNTSYVSEYYNQFDSKRSKIMKASKWLPILGVSYYNTELFYPSLLSIVKPNRRNRFDRKGNYTYPEIKRKTQILKEKENLIVQFNNEYIKKMKTLCEKNDIQLICYFSPMAKKSASTTNDNYTVVNHSDLFKSTTYFYDAIHVNTKGRFVASVNFAAELKGFLK
jgi:hypothetical protein